MVELLRNTRIDAEQGRFLDMIQVSGRALVDVINGISHREFAPAGSPCLPKTQRVILGR